MAGRLLLVFHSIAQNSTKIEYQMGMKLLETMSQEYRLQVKFLTCLAPGSIKYCFLLIRNLGHMKVDVL